jgi:prepilin-type N-terminal cleavage/methylation domain-containing protein
VKRFLSKRSGFTLAEILVAFVVFAIMASMIMAVMRLAIAQRSSNNELEKSIEQQNEKYVVQAKDYTYGAADGTVDLEFSNGSSFSFDYTIRGKNADGSEDNPYEGAYEDTYEGINYFVGNLDYTKSGDLESSSGSDDSSGGSGSSVTNRLDSRIYGSTNFESITILDCRKDTSYNESGKSRYLIEVSAINNSNTSDDTKPYRQYRLAFTSEVLECGYVTPATFRSDSPNCLSNETHYPSEANQMYDVRSTSTKSVRIALTNSDVADKGEAFDSTYSKSDRDTTSYIYVVFNGDPGLTVKSFGSNGTDNGYGAYVYKQFVQTTTTTGEDGTTTTTQTVYPNIYGAYVKE